MSRIALIVSFATLLGLQSVRGQAIDYARDVLPILSDKCYHCHGPDEHARKAKLRLDEREGLLRTRDGVTVAIPHKPSESELIRRITSKDPDERMPPVEDIRKLSAAQIETLTRWVEQGAQWGMHWAFVPPTMPAIGEPPEKNPIDALVVAKLRARNLQPAAEADRATLIRRVSLDLTGLPPTPAEIEDFLRDESPGAFEKVVDRLLASPRYGERMASEWLDLARYADTHGYQADRYRAMWPWRDWVIKAFNENRPYDQFVTWQLAGDLLPNATKEQRLATAFNRHHMQNVEGGIVEEEFRVAYVVDRVNTFGTAVLGLTFECSRCHDHKFDPITQRDFYALFAFFQNIDEAGQISWFTDAMPTPAMLLTDDAVDTRLAEIRQDIAEKAAQLEAARQDASTALKQWIIERGDAPPADPDGEGLIAHYAFDELTTTQPANSVDPGKPGQAVQTPESIDGKFGRGIALTGDNGFIFPGGIGHFGRAEAFSLSIWVRTPAHAPRMVVVHKSMAPVDAASRGYELLLEDGRVAFGLHHFWPGNSLKVVTQESIDVNQWTHLGVTYDGSSRAAGVRMYIDGTPAAFDIVRDGLTRDITYGGGTEYDLAIGYRFRDNGFKGGAVDEFRVFRRALDPLNVQQLAGTLSPTPLRKLVVEQPDAVLDHFLATAYLPARKLAEELAVLRRAENELVMTTAEIMVMKELPTPKPAFVLTRGAYDAPGEAVSAATPAFLPPIPKNQPRNRLGLARWSFATDNPLTARVTVNRAWQQMFGRGIVETSDNFGRQGAQPTNQEMLDFLARSFADEMHWDMKRLLKTIALSATYRQSSRASAEQLASDPDNALLCRGPSRRLTAEMLRDQALNVSGLLVEKLGGPPVKPYQPEGLWNVAMGNPHYDQSTGEGLYRRSLYTFWKRSVPPPAMTAFDAADRSNCTVKRQSTSTPLQALVLLNDPQIVEAARFVSQRMIMEGGSTTAARVAWAFQLVTQQTATAAERDVLLKLFDEQRALFAKDESSAEQLLNVGERRNDENLNRVDLAAGTVLAIALFNHDAAIMRR